MKKAAITKFDRRLTSRCNKRRARRPLAQLESLKPAGCSGLTAAVSLREAQPQRGLDARRIIAIRSHSD